MRNPVVLAVRRGLICALSCAALSMALPAAAEPQLDEPLPNAARPDGRLPTNVKSRIPFTQRYYAVRHGGLVRAANSAITCRDSAANAAADVPCLTARGGTGAAANHAYDMFYVDVDDDPNTYNSSRGEIRLPEDAQVSYARLYWGGNLRVGEQKPPKDNGRVLIAEPGGEYKELLADSTIGHRTADGADAYQASADVTDLVRGAGPGLYTVAQVNVAMGRSAVGAWGGWTMVVAYEKKSEPLRHLAVWDGFQPLNDTESALDVDLGGLRIPKGAGGRLGIVAYDGDRGITGDSLTLTAGTRKTVLSDYGNSADDVLNSTITDDGVSRAGRNPGHRNTLGYDSDVFDLRGALEKGADRLGVRLESKRDFVWLGALLLQADARP
ncbi:DUF3344 domain-containing protein [Streptomyces sp. NPDC047928]|uniref:DUF3344 domain-containing protein n=1 Tax=unclassified Streptomyces TaxID=2593676 RepID=UPI003712A2BF